MTSRPSARSLLNALALITALLLPSAGRASDHADPMWLAEDEQEANITGLFFFPEGDQYVAILDVRRSLVGPPPYNLEPFEYNIHMDFHTKLRFDRAEDLARYGGTIDAPEGIAPDATIRIRLDNDAKVKETSFKGLGDAQSIRVFSGVRDDPFIFPKFFGVNVITMAFSIPQASFPEHAESFVLWATSNRVDGGEQIDHVGRSNRTQLGRFEILNKIPPSQHVAEIKEKAEPRGKVQAFLAQWLPPLANLNQLSGFLIRHYDAVPDVMIFTRTRPPGFPNGRRLEDDVARLTCAQGDCPLQENAFIDTMQWPRSTVNDKPLTTEFPYLAEAWPPKPQPAGATGPYVVRFFMRPLVQIAIGALLLLFIIRALIHWFGRRSALKA
ncbi:MULTISPECIES: hypothetical protein [Methylosinus]|uniref:DUF4331 domain-containing protein n=1 Tax=Methylosinus trichosporium (strain ATCC 35070 / NCIMB 11131 / UNIQEM 75 / OB3b) TaxID=595536 RepID=A0A2D2D389_METT3|nr:MULTISPECIES: hypothetical protein [Methylosinus]ATQ69437.1 hypothetical protein CQW49_17250 [Methylosinus trichosporium OB3b]OBS52948.1 hypothetical protein A8B73_08660 [Methylosinus sp. 3S-1]